MAHIPSSCDPIQYADPNITVFVVENLGPRCQETFIVMPTMIIYILLLLLGVIGNACTCLVIIADKSMHNPTNFYLFSLAVSDIIILLLGLPMELHGVIGYVYPYEFSSFVCRLRAFLIEFTSYASVTVICAFSVERYFAICFPLRAKLFSTLTRAVTVILISWAVSFVAALPMAAIVNVQRLEVPPGVSEEMKKLISSDGLTVDRTEFCAMDYTQEGKDRQKVLIYVSFLIFFTLPAILMSFMYGHIAVRLRCADRMLTKDKNEATSRTSRSRRTVIKVLVSVVVTFFAFWLPFHAQRLLSVFFNDHPDAILTISAISTCYYSNSVCNPILYNILSENYRRAFCRVILGERLARKLFPNLSQDLRGYSFHSTSHMRRISGSVQQTRLSISAPCKHSVITLKQYPAEVAPRVGERRRTEDLMVPRASESDYLILAGASPESGESI
ncbi:nmur-2 [Pristionchus pacificus]|uniref:Nmur-2 n=1 Tax=Pristionchus pacificus TaxID=54126 RepID=A0A2A6CW69_PRIPA|nr:nmur-2 [Pristionchus pacificus]|eukprot:PDM82261.1 nmur-2 [Pristionchus pacificus]